MIKEIVKDTNVLSQKSERFEFDKDEHLIQDMLDTAKANDDVCVGLACVQIGVPKRVILVKQGDKFIPFINPSIINKSTETYRAVEKCLSFDEPKEVRRHKKIKVCYTTINKKMKVEQFSGYTAQIIQHECDHLNGTLI